MIKRGLCVIATSMAMGVLTWLYLSGVGATWGTAAVSGVVVDADGPGNGTTVRIQATVNSTTSASDGTFTDTVA